MLFLVPLVRFPGFVWIIAVGFALPGMRAISPSPGAAANVNVPERAARTR